MGVSGALGAVDGFEDKFLKPLGFLFSVPFCLIKTPSCDLSCVETDGTVAVDGEISRHCPTAPIVVKGVLTCWSSLPAFSKLEGTEKSAPEPKRGRCRDMVSASFS